MATHWDARNWTILGMGALATAAAALLTFAALCNH